MCTLSSGVWPGGRQAEFCQLLPPDFAVLPAVVLVTRYRSLMGCLSYIQSNIETALALSIAPTSRPEVKCYNHVEAPRSIHHVQNSAISHLSTPQTSV